VGDLSTNFSRREFRDRRTGSLPKDPPASLIGRLEALRCRIGRPLPIVSGYRTPTTNRAVGGAVNSRHLSGDAVDIPEGLVRMDEAVAAGFTGIGTRNGWVVHVDCRPGPLKTWTY
jgi:zinc D-Ala-D-Ala carboxypeptidase